MTLPLPVVGGPVATAATGTPTTGTPSAADLRSGGVGAQAETGAGTVPAGPVAGDGPRVGAFSLTRSVWGAAGARPRVVVRVDGAAGATRLTLRVRSTASGRVVARQSLGRAQGAAPVRRALARRLAAMPGAYTVAVVARDAAGHAVRAAPGVAPALALRIDRAATATAAAPAGTYVFPVQGRCNFRSLDAQRFHAGRAGGRLHNGQDIGTYSGYPPVVAVTASTVQRVWFDAAGGGWTVVMNGDDGTAYGYLHLKPGTIRVRAGQRLAAGQAVANAGRSGGNYEPHLHFEMRPIPWSGNAARATDPLPLLSSLPNTCDG